MTQDGAAVPSLLRLWRQWERRPAGRRLFSFAVCRRAPYFGTVRPRLLQLEPGLAVARIPNRRAVHNHLRGVHAIALCNAAEFAMGMLMEATTPNTHRWIPKGMQVNYLARAGTDIVATARGTVETDAEAGRDNEITIVLTDGAGKVVCEARITVWVTPKPAR